MNARASFNLARLRLQGRGGGGGGERDEVGAMRLMRLAASLGEGAALLRLGKTAAASFIASPDASEGDHAEAFRNFCASAEAGIPEAQLWLGDLIDEYMCLYVYIYICTHTLSLQIDI